MKFSAQEEYGLRCLIAIAKAQNGDSLTIPEIAKSEELSEPHVAKLLTILRRSGFIKSARGHTGGYSLAKDPKEIVVGDVLAALGGRLYSKGFCDKHAGLASKCVHETECAVLFLWSDIQQAVDGVVYKLTLSEILSRHPESVKNATFLKTPPMGVSGRKSGVRAV